MSAPAAVRIIPKVLNVVVLVVSGAYLLVYLYRWEWNRAVISGVFFIAAEIALATSLILAAVRRRGDPEIGTVARSITSANAGTARRHFDWLAQNDRLGVFIPVLLGAGVILSALAYVVERVAGALVGPSVDVHSAQLIGIDLPLGGPGEAAPGAGERSSRSRLSRLLLWAMATVAALLLVVAGVDVLADATQSRLSEQEATTGTTTVVLAVGQKNLVRSDADLAEALWIVCRSVAPPDASLASIRPVESDRVELVLRPAMGELRRRRVFGCFEDAVIDRVDVDVVSWTER